CRLFYLVFFFTAPPPTPLSTLSLHDALPISVAAGVCRRRRRRRDRGRDRGRRVPPQRAEDRDRCCASRAHRAHDRSRAGPRRRRSEEHTSELQSRFDLVCRLLLEKKKKENTI